MIEMETTADQKMAFEILKKVLQSEKAEIRDVQEPAFIRAKHGHWYALTPRNDSKILAINVVPSEEGSKVTITTSLSGETIGGIYVNIIILMLAIYVWWMPELISVFPGLILVFYVGVLGMIITVVNVVWLVVSIDKFASEIVRSLP